MKITRSFFFPFLFAAIAMGSSAQTTESAVQQDKGQETAATIEVPQMYAVLYQQAAAEYRALCYQAFNMARYQLDRMLEGYDDKKPPAVVVDIDETMLDNSPYEARCILDGTAYPEGWDQWVNEASARAVPGALAFLQHAQSKGVRVFYVSNRKEQNMMATLDNMKKLGFPFSQQNYLLLKREERSKKARRDQVARQANILMLIGDNLVDFSEVFEGQDVQGRFDIVDRFSDKFGSRFILLPNAIYGDWLTVLYSDQPEATDQEKQEMLRKALITQ